MADLVSTKTLNVFSQRIPTNAEINLQQRSRKHLNQITSRLKAITSLCHSVILNGGDDILKDINHQLVDIESRFVNFNLLFSFMYSKN